MIACALVAPASAAARADESVLVTIVDDAPVVVEWAAFERAGVVVQALNSGSAAVPATVFVTPFAASAAKTTRTNAQMFSLEMGDGRYVPLDRVVSVTLEPRAITSFTLRQKTGAPRPDPGRYPRQGYAVLTLACKAGRAVSRRIALDVAGPPTLQPAVGEVHAWGYRLFPWGPVSRCASCELPTSGDLSVLANRSEIGRLSGKREGTALLTPVPVINGQPADVLRFFPKGVGAAGEYAGTIQLGASDDKKTSAAVNLTVKDELLVPLFVLLVGSWLALLVKNYLGVVRERWTLLQREAAVAVAFDASQAAFLRAAGARAYATYSLDAAVEAERHALVEKIDTLTKASRGNIDTSSADYRDLLESFDRLEKAVRAWPMLPARLADLETALAAVREADDRLPRGRAEPPAAILRVLPPLLRGTALQSLTAYDARQTAIAEGTTYAHTWLKRAERIANGFLRYHELSAAANSATGARLKQAHDQLAIAATALRAGDESAVSTGSLIKDIDTFEATLATIGAGPSTRGAALLLLPRARADLAHGSEALLLLDRLDRLETMSAAAPPSDPAARVAFYQARRRRWDVTMFLAAFAVAALTALQRLYLDKPFGSFGDYVSLLLLALGTRGAAEAVSAALEWFGRRIVPP